MDMELDRDPVEDFIEQMAHHEVVFTFIVILFVLAVGLLAVFGTALYYFMSLIAAARGRLATLTTSVA